MYYFSFAGRTSSSLPTLSSHSVSGYLGQGLRPSGPPGIIGFYPYSCSSLIPQFHSSSLVVKLLGELLCSSIEVQIHLWCNECRVVCLNKGCYHSLYSITSIKKGWTKLLNRSIELIWKKGELYPLYAEVLQVQNSPQLITGSRRVRQSRHRSSVYLCGQPTDTLGPFKTDNASPPRITATAGTRLVRTDRRVYSLCSSPLGVLRDQV